MFVLEKLQYHAGSGKPVLVHRDESVTYDELDRQSDAFAAWLLAELGEDRSPVVIYGEKQARFLCCIYGALKSGRAYVPVDAVTPVERVVDILADIRPRVVVDFTGLLQTDGGLLDAAALERIVSQAPINPVESRFWVREHDTAYILFTSGSTGKPKGVPITVRNLTSFYKGTRPFMGAPEDGVILNQISYSFDVSACSLYVGVAMGMTLFTIDRDMLENLGGVLQELRGSRLTTWVSTPSFAEICVQSSRFHSGLLPSLERFLFCGEVLTHKLCDQLAERFPVARVVNTYGPTEATVLVTAVEVTGAMRADSRPIPIGRPLEDVELRIVNGDGAAREDGGQGELLIVGDSVGPGYHNRPGLTAERFFADARTGKRGYRTGDICYRADGLYYYAGRADNQLKLNGFRIELEDIENNLARVSNVSRAAVLPVWKDERVSYLAAFLLLERDDGMAPLQRSIQIKRLAAAYLPDYMIPRKLFYVDAFPLNINGKIDKNVLAGRLRNE